MSAPRCKGCGDRPAWPKSYAGLCKVCIGARREARREKWRAAEQERRGKVELALAALTEAEQAAGKVPPEGGEHPWRPVVELADNRLIFTKIARDEYAFDVVAKGARREFPSVRQAYVFATVLAGDYGIPARVVLEMKGEG